MMKLHLILILLPLVLSQGIMDGQPCPGNTDTDCASGFCDSSSGTSICEVRPSPNGKRCDKGQETSHCESGYCEQSTGVCEPQRRNGPCTDSNFCIGSDLCEVQRSSGNQVCLANSVGSGDACDFDAQCPGKERCNSENVCAEGDPTTTLLGDDEPCEDGPQCESGICADKIANDGNNKVCLAKDVGEGADCSIDQQCTTGYCVPQGQDNQLTCQNKPDPPITDPPNPGPSDTPSPPGGGDETVTETVTRDGGRVETVVQTRVIGGAAGTASRASASASRVSSSVRSSTSARASGAATKIIEGMSGWLGLVATVLGAIVL